MRNVRMDADPVPPARIEVVPAIPAIPVRPRAPQSLCELAAVVGFAGRLIPEKGVDVFLLAAALVAVVVPEAPFIVIGDGPLRAEQQELADRLGLLAARTRFLDVRD